MDDTRHRRPVDFDDLSVDQQIAYVQTLWDEIASQEEQVPVPAWHREILDARLTEIEADPDAGRAWEEVEIELRSRLASRR
jgi:putative addiction module component (TIGR02574 family)